MLPVVPDPVRERFTGGCHGKMPQVCGQLSGLEGAHFVTRDYPFHTPAQEVDVVTRILGFQLRLFPFGVA